MSRELKRVPLDFHWPMHRVWDGFVNPHAQLSRTCPCCGGSGLKDNTRGTSRGEYDPANDCPRCDGNGMVWVWPEDRAAFEAWEPTPPPSGEGWQMWETTSEGSPISPVMETPEDLARWLDNNRASAFADQSATYEQWLAMIGGPGWAISAVGTVGPGGVSIVSGVAAGLDR